MNQDGNTAMPQKPSFSSPNPGTPNPATPNMDISNPEVSSPAAPATQFASADIDSAPAGQAAPAAIFSDASDAAESAPADSSDATANQAVASAAAAMPDDGTVGTITSTPTPVKNSARGLFGNRRFKSQPAAPTTFAGAPDFFNQAAAEQSGDYITIGADPKAPASGTKKRLIIIGAIAGLAIVVAIAAAVIPQITNKMAHSDERLKENWTKLACAFAYGKDECGDLSSLKNVKLTVKTENEKVDYSFYKNEIENFKKTVPSQDNTEKEKNALVGAESIRNNIIALEIYDDFNRRQDDYVTNSIIARRGEESTANGFIESASKSGMAYTAYGLVKSYIRKKYQLLESYYQKGCNTSELLSGQSECITENRSEDENRLINEVHQLFQMISIHSSEPVSSIGKTLQDVLEDIGEND